MKKDESDLTILKNGSYEFNPEHDFGVGKDKAIQQLLNYVGDKESRLRILINYTKRQEALLNRRACQSRWIDGYVDGLKKALEIVGAKVK